MCSDRQNAYVVLIADMCWLWVLFNKRGHLWVWCVYISTVKAYIAWSSEIWMSVCTSIFVCLYESESDRQSSSCKLNWFIILKFFWTKSELRFPTLPAYIHYAHLKLCYIANPTEIEFLLTLLQNVNYIISQLYM